MSGKKKKKKKVIVSNYQPSATQHKQMDFLSVIIVSLQWWLGPRWSEANS